MNIVEAATRRRVTVGMVTLTFVLFGLIALSDLKVNLLPDLELPDSDGPHRIRKVRRRSRSKTSISAAGRGSDRRGQEPAQDPTRCRARGSPTILLEFARGTNMDQGRIDVRDKLGHPAAAASRRKKPVLLRFNPSDRPDPAPRLDREAEGRGGQGRGIGETRTETVCAGFADDELKKRLEPHGRRRRGESRRRPRGPGGCRRSISMRPPCSSWGSAQLDVVKRLSDSRTSTSPAAASPNAQQRYLVRTVNQFGHARRRCANLLINRSTTAYRSCLQGHRRSSRQGYKEREGIVRVDGHEAIELAVYKEGDANDCQRQRMR